ncbi:MAG: tetratricopeptide repeat protein [Candidatus Marinimicrobia bacterium]|nr:tetratricopeptide repeat protein [Candidatus Neomarinimicrobiota bacterium]
MKTQKILALLVLFLLVSCTKSAEELLELSENNVQNNKIDLAIKDLQNLLKKYPADSLASRAQYKLASIYLNWKNDPEMGYDALQKTVNKYAESVHGEQARNQIVEFPEYIINKAESLRKQKLLKEAVNHLMYMTNKYEQHKLASKAQYMLGDVYMNDFRDFTTAVQEYRKVLENHSGSGQEPHALFMIGYIYANVINDEKSAKIEYNDFLKRFPKHELAPSVKFEIEYLGKSIEEIPALKHITS